VEDVLHPGPALFAIESVLGVHGDLGNLEEGSFDVAIDFSAIGEAHGLPEVIDGEGDRVFNGERPAHDEVFHGPEDILFEGAQGTEGARVDAPDKIGLAFLAGDFGPVLDDALLALAGKEKDGKEEDVHLRLGELRLLPGGRLGLFLGTHVRRI